MVKVLLLRGPGTNCDMETGFAFELAGASVQDVYVKTLLNNHRMMKDFQIFVIPGGFTYGDDLGAGKVMAIEIKKFLFHEVRSFVDRGGLVLGICNGFQILVKSGLLPYCDGKQHITLTLNTRGTFIDRWVKLSVEGERCVFLRGIQEIELPVANAEGRVVFLNKDEERKLENGNLVCMRYRSFDPSDSTNHIAGITDKTGRMLGLMPHPERNIFKHSHPEWKRGIYGGDGLRIFRNAVRYFQ